MKALAGDIKHVGDRVAALESSQEDTLTKMDAHRKAIVHNGSQISELYMILDDQENRISRNNIRIRGVLKSVVAPHMSTLACSIFNQLLGRLKDDPIEIDRAHRLLGSKNANPACPRDIIYLLNYFTVKE